jgi:arginine exporter protein ArgO
VIAWTPFAAGIAAGLGIALPLGAIGVLIVREGVERGIRAACVAALAVATVDFGYALVAVVVGERLAETLSGVERLVQLVGALALAVVVVLGVGSLLRGVRRTQQVRPVGSPVDPGAGSVRLSARESDQLERMDLPVGYRGTFLRFVGLTAINPMTAVYFVALTTGLSSRLAGPGAGAAFAVGVLLGSLAWQMVLAIGGAAAGSRMSEHIRIGVSLVGYTIVAAYAVKLALGG